MRSKKFNKLKGRLLSRNPNNCYDFVVVPLVHGQRKQKIKMPFDEAKPGFSCQPKPAIWCQDTADHTPDVILQTNGISTPFLPFCRASREEDLLKMQISRS